RRRPDRPVAIDAHAPAAAAAAADVEGLADLHGRHVDVDQPAGPDGGPVILPVVHPHSPLRVLLNAREAVGDVIVGVRPGPALDVVLGRAGILAAGPRGDPRVAVVVDGHAVGRDGHVDDLGLAGLAIDEAEPILAGHQVGEPEVPLGVDGPAVGRQRRALEARDIDRELDLPAVAVDQADLRPGVLAVLTTGRPHLLLVVHAGAL